MPQLRRDELALLEHARKRRARRDQRLEIGLAVLVERGGHRDHDRVRPRQVRLSARFRGTDALAPRRATSVRLR